MKSYYSEKLAAERLKRCYDIAPPRIRQYLYAEVNHVSTKIRPGDTVLELGCGYGRIFPQLSPIVAHIVGIDSSIESVLFARKFLRGIPNYTLFNMDALHLAFRDKIFDLVLCIQNGISAFQVDKQALILESIRVTKPGGVILYSSYSEKVWNARLHWFKLQAREGLLGEIDFRKSGNGKIVCKDGFSADTVTREQFLALTANLNIRRHIVEVDQSSLFCEIFSL